MINNAESVVIVTGSRAFSDFGLLSRHLSSRKPTLVVHGGERGADYLSGMWAEENAVSTHVERAKWDTYRQRAGFIRNTRMLKLFPNALVLAFTIRRSMGAWNCIREAKKLGMIVEIIRSAKT